MDTAATAAKAHELQRLHRDPELLLVVNVWDVITARVVADTPGTKALATASHSIAAAYGYPDGEQIPRDLMIEAVGRIAAAVDLPVTADLEAGYGDAGETVARAIDVGIVGANLEDQMKPLPDAVRAVEAAVAAGERAGIPFVLNARTDAFVKAGDRNPADVLAEAVERGRAFLDAGGQRHRRPRLARPRHPPAPGRRSGVLRPVEPERGTHRARRARRGRLRRRRPARGHPQAQLSHLSTSPCRRPLREKRGRVRGARRERWG